jgi:fatty-acyl-CoA synthase
MLAVRYCDWIAHHARRALDKVAALDLASERRFSSAGCSRLASFFRPTQRRHENRSP